MDLSSPLQAPPCHARHARRGLSLAAVAFALSSCLYAVIEQQCASNADCGEGWQCIAQTCVMQPGGAPLSTGGGGNGGAGGAAGASSAGGGAAGAGGASNAGGGPDAGQRCDDRSCSGCCAGTTCVAFASQSASTCGSDGRVCLGCAAQAMCVSGRCLGGSCNANSCPNGCCSGTTCVTRQSPMACGVGGGLCQNCGANTACAMGACVAALPRPDGGLLTGAACTDSVQCQGPPTAFCVPPALGMLETGYLGGYCSRPCTANGACPAGAVCVTETIGSAISTSCKQACSNPLQGQGVCRSGYVCSFSANAAAWCGPRCNNQSAPCLGGGGCNVATGYCQ